MVWLSDGEKQFEYMFIYFDRIHERVGRTDRRETINTVIEETDEQLTKNKSRVLAMFYFCMQPEEMFDLLCCQ